MLLGIPVKLALTLKEITRPETFTGIFKVIGVCSFIPYNTLRMWHAVWARERPLRGIAIEGGSFIGKCLSNPNLTSLIL